MIPNLRKKAWVEALLTKRPAIEHALGVPLGKMLGCGHWGCVLDSTPPWVVKLSIDPTEGPIWSKIAGLVKEEVWGDKGFTEIKSIHRLTPDIPYGGRKKKVWAIVREGVEPVFESVRGSLRYSDYTREQLGLDKDTEVHGSSLAAYGSDAEDFSRALDGLGRYQAATRAWHAMKRSTRSMAYQKFVSREDAEEKIERIVQHAFQGGIAAPLGESLHLLAMNGIYLRDVHLMNIGWHVPRDPDDDWARIVIFDPGHTPTGGAEIESLLIENGREAL
jgi:hypothetical protein